METTEEGSKGGKRSHNFSLRFEGRQVKLDGPHCLPQSVCSSLNECCINDSATEKFKIMGSVPFPFLESGPE